MFAAATLVAGAGRAGEGAACSREGGEGGGGRSGACLFLRFPPSTDTLAAFSSTPLSVPISADGEDVEEEVELFRWIRNCSARSRNSFLMIQLVIGQLRFKDAEVFCSPDLFENLGLWQKHSHITQPRK